MGSTSAQKRTRADRQGRTNCLTAGKTTLALVNCEGERNSAGSHAKLDSTQVFSPTRWHNCNQSQPLGTLGCQAGHFFCCLTPAQNSRCLVSVRAKRNPQKSMVALVHLALLQGCGAHATSSKTTQTRPLYSTAGEYRNHHSESTTAGRASGDLEVISPANQQFEALQDQYAQAKAIRSYFGKATYYSNTLTGRAMASGEIYDPNAAQAAHRSLPFGSVLRVTPTKGGLSVIVRVTDRGPFAKGRLIDLSYAAARQIGLLRAGVLDVRVDVLTLPNTRYKGDPKITR